MKKSTTFVRRRLLPEGATVCVLADSWVLTCPAGVEAALQQLMPGAWDQGHVTRMTNQIAHARADPRAAPNTPTTPGEVHALLQLLDLSQLGAVLDPWAGTGVIKREPGRHGVPVLDNDLNPAHAADLHDDALQPVFYRRASTLAPVDAVIASPWFTVLDLALPLAVAAARVVTCMHVPGHYITDAHPIRARYLADLMSAGRVHILWNLPKGPMGRRCGWLLVFASPHAKQLLMRAGNLPSATLSYAQT